MCWFVISGLFYLFFELFFSFEKRMAKGDIVLANVPRKRVRAGVRNESGLLCTKVSRRLRRRKNPSPPPNATSKNDSRVYKIKYRSTPLQTVSGALRDPGPSA